MDGSTFVAASDLCPDLQLALGRLQSLADAVRDTPPEAPDYDITWY